RGDRAPRGGRLEVVHEDRSARRGPGDRGAHEDRRGRERPDPRGRREPGEPHPFTLPAMTPRMYQRWRITNTSSTGSTVTTAPAIISSVSCTCSPTRLASATGSV